MRFGFMEIDDNAEFDIKEYLVNEIRNTELRIPIFIQKIIRKAAEESGLSFYQAAKISLTALKEIQQKNLIPELRRHEKDIFYRTGEDGFGGELNIDRRKLLYEKYIAGDNGYVTGRLLLNSLGLTTWVANITEIVSNKTNKKIFSNNKTKVIMPPFEKLTKENIPYFKLLDVLSLLDNSPIDCSNKYNIIEEKTDFNSLNKERLYLMDKKYYKGKCKPHLQKLEALCLDYKNIKHYLIDEIKKVELTTPIFVKKIIKKISLELDINFYKTARLSLIALKEIEQENIIPQLRCYEKNIYYKTEMNIFGREFYINYELLQYGKYIEGYNGYITRHELINSLGLTTFMAAKRYIVSNNVRKTTIEEDGLLIIVPAFERLNKNNIPYFKLLDVLSILDNVVLDCYVDEYEVIHQKLVPDNMDYSRLKELDNKYYEGKGLKHILRLEELCRDPA